MREKRWKKKQHQLPQLRDCYADDADAGQVMEKRRKAHLVQLLPKKIQHKSSYVGMQMMPPLILLKKKKKKKSMSKTKKKKKQEM